MPERILVIGCPGSGKSTLARRLGEQAGLPVVHLDRLFWLPGWVERSNEDFDALLMNELKKERWIIDGNFGRTLPLRLQYCDTVIWLDYGRFTCVFGVIRRVLRTLGRVRPDMGEGCPERFDLSFLKFVWNFKKGSGLKIVDSLADAPSSVRLIRARSRRDLERQLTDLFGSVR